MDHLEDMNDETRQGVVLLIEPDEGLARGMENELLREGFDVVWSSSHLKALSILEDRKDTDVVLVKAEPTDIGGHDFVHLLRHRNRFAERCLQIILIASGEFFERFPPSEAGINDYLLRPYFPGELTWRVAKAVKAVRSKQKRDSTLLLDQFSGILTSAGLEKVLHEELNKIVRRNGVLSIILYRQHGLEAIGLSHGQMMVDWMERDLSVAIRGSLRSYDRLGMFEGGGYCLVAPDVGADHLPMLTQRLVQSVRDWNIKVAQHSHIQIPIVLALTPVAVHPDCQPSRLNAVAKLFWDWIQLIHSKKTSHEEHILEIRLTDQGVEDVGQ